MKISYNRVRFRDIRGRPWDNIIIFSLHSTFLYQRRILIKSEVPHSAPCRISSHGSLESPGQHQHHFTSYHSTAFPYNSTDVYAFNICFYCHPFHYLLTTLNYSVITLAVQLPSSVFLLLCLGRQQEWEHLKPDTLMNLTHCWEFHMNCCMVKALCSTSDFTVPTKDRTSPWILKCLNA